MIRLGSGTTFYSTGFVGIIKLTTTETLLSKYSASLYQKLQDDGHLINYKRNGSIGLATTTDRYFTLKRLQAETLARKISCKLLSAEECKEKFPLLKIDDLEGGLWVDDDGTVSTKDLLNTFVNECRKNDIKIVEDCEVTKIITKQSRGGLYHKVRGVETTHGTIECDFFVNCAGIRARELGKLSVPRVKVPIHACEHYHMITKPFGQSSNLPIVYDYDGSIYIRENEGGLLFGGFEKVAKPIFHSQVPKTFESQTLQPDLDHFCKSFADYFIIYDVI